MLHQFLAVVLQLNCARITADWHEHCRVAFKATCKHTHNGCQAMPVLVTSTTLFLAELLVIAVIDMPQISGNSADWQSITS